MIYYTIIKSEARSPKSETNPNFLNENFQNLFRISIFDIRISPLWLQKSVPSVLKNRACPGNW